MIFTLPLQMVPFFKKTQANSGFGNFPNAKTNHQQDIIWFFDK